MDPRVVPTRAQHHLFEEARKLWERKENVRKSRKGKPASYALRAASALSDMDQLLDKYPVGAANPSRSRTESSWRTSGRPGDATSEVSMPKLLRAGRGGKNDGLLKRQNKQQWQQSPPLQPPPPPVRWYLLARGAGPDCWYLQQRHRCKCSPSSCILNRLEHRFVP